MLIQNQIIERIYGLFSNRDWRQENRDEDKANLHRDEEKEPPFRRGDGPRRGGMDERVPRRGFDEDRGPRRALDEDRGPRRALDDDRGLRRGLDEDRGPRRGFDDERGPRRGMDEMRGPRRGADDDQGPRRGDDARPWKPLSRPGKLSAGTWMKTSRTETFGRAHKE